MSQRALGPQFEHIDSLHLRGDHPSDPRTYLGNDSTYHEQVAGAQADDARVVYEKLKSDIAQRGILDPVWVDEHNNVVNGHHRIAAARELGITHVPVERD